MFSISLFPGLLMVTTLKMLTLSRCFLKQENLLKIVFLHIQVCKQPKLLISLGGQGGREPGRIGRSGRGTGGRRGTELEVYW